MKSCSQTLPSTLTTAAWTILSSRAAIPSGRIRPSALGTQARRAGFDRYAPRPSRACSSRRLASRFCSYCRQVTPSTPGAASRLRPRNDSRNNSGVT
jgi:hypothetical protein